MAQIKLTSWFLICGALFFLSFIPRYFFIKATPDSNKSIDLLIYINGGQLIANQVNPYDFNDKVEIRTRIRTDPRFIHTYSLGDEGKWNYYASGNLPASLLYYGAIEYVAKGDPVTYRLVFAAADSLLSVLIALLVIQFWMVRPLYLKFGVAILLGVLNPVLLHYGTLIPEDKGLQIALMIASLLFAKANKTIWSAIFLGLAISFKGVGIFVLPLCLYYLFGSPATLSQVWTRSNQIIFLKYGFTSTLICFLLFIPFMPEVLTMMQTRLTLSASGIPEHSSIWRVPYDLFPSIWEFIRLVFIVALLLFTLLGYLRKKFDLEIVSATILVLFIDILLNAGSLDRMNIGFLCAILILGTSKLYWENWFLISVYLILGLVGFIVYSDRLYIEDAEAFDSSFSLAFVILFTSLLAHRFLNPGRFVTVGGIVILSIGLLIFLFNVQQTASKAGAKQILYYVGMGKLRPESVVLTSSQKKEIESMISLDVANYNSIQRSMIGAKFLSPQEILDLVGLGKLNPEGIDLTSTQRAAIDSTISLNPGGFNEAQKALIKRD